MIFSKFYVFHRKHKLSIDQAGGPHTFSILTRFDSSQTYRPIRRSPLAVWPPRPTPMKVLSSPGRLSDMTKKKRPNVLTKVLPCLFRILKLGHTIHNINFESMSPDHPHNYRQQVHFTHTNGFTWWFIIRFLYKSS